jgi:hypothetical protein
VGEGCDAMTRWIFFIVVVKKMRFLGLCAQFHDGGDTNKKSDDVRTSPRVFVMF